MKYIITPKNSNVEGYCYSGCGAKCATNCPGNCPARGNECGTFCYSKG
jgi:Cys-rich peptide (Clo7bot family)